MRKDIMAITVKELIEHLKTLPEDFIVEVGKEECDSSGYEKWLMFDDLKIECTEVFYNIVRLKGDYS
jgi:hypothetical protein